MPRRARKQEPQPVTHPDLVPIFGVRREVEEQIEKLQEKQGEIDDEIREFVAKHYNVTDDPHVDPDDLEIVFVWVCEKGSPTGYCVYDNANDPANDCCLYCGEPRERK